MTDATAGAGRTQAVRSRPAPVGGRVDIGTCRRVTVTAVSERGWRDDAALLADMRASGGPDTSQWLARWRPGNGAGSSTLVQVEALDGSRFAFLIDTGWDPAYMAGRYRDLGVDRMLRDGEVAFLYLTHEHLDHLWGVEAVLSVRPDIEILSPSTFGPEADRFLDGAEYPEAGARNRVPHTGRRVRLEPGGVHRLAPGVASVTFDLPILLGIEGEQSLFFHVADRGIVCVTGCCHQTITRFADYARENLAGGERLYGLYGGLHLAPFGEIEPDKEELIEALGSYGFQKIAANHCTGLPAVERMLALGYPVVRGSGRAGSRSDLYVGNGDSVTFG